jgi:hypothetical protein
LKMLGKANLEKLANIFNPLKRFLALSL